MSEKPRIDRKAVYSGKEDLPELELSDEDILDAMRHIPGYLDISTQVGLLVNNIPASRRYPETWL